MNPHVSSPGRGWQLLLLFCALLLMAPLGQLPADAARKQGRSSGTISGRLTGGSAASKVRLQFSVDGARIRARFRRATFTLAGVPAGEHTLSVIDPSTNSGAHYPVRVRGGRTVKIGAVSLQQGGQITGLVSKVTDYATGALEPLAGVEVVAEAEIVPEPRPLGGASHQRSQARLVAVTDASGAYAFRAVPTGTYRVSVVAPGLEAGVQFAWVQQGFTSVADFLLRTAIEEGVATLSGTVTSGGSAPLEGALVTVYTDDFYYPPVISDPARNAAAALGKPGRATSRSLPRGSFTTLTDRDGRYTLNVPSGYLRLSVWLDGYLPVDQALTLQPRESRTLDYALEAQPAPTVGTVAGTVTRASDGTPVQGARVSIPIFYTQSDTPVDAPPGGGGGTSPLPPAFLVAETDAAGKFRIDGVPTGTWDVLAEAAGFASQSGRVDVTEGGTAELAFVLAGADQ